MIAKIELTAEIAHINPALLAQAAGGSSVWQEVFGEKTYIVVEGCDQAALEAALTDPDVVANAQTREAAVVETENRAAWEAAKADHVDAHQGLEAVNCTFELTLPALAALVRVVSALAASKTPTLADVQALTDTLADVEALETVFSEPTLASSLTVPDPVGYITTQRERAAELRQAVAGA